MRQYICAYVMDPGWHPNTPSWNVGESAALSTTSLRVTTVSRCLLQRPRKQRFLRQLHMAISSAFTLAAPHVSHQHRHHEFKGRKINDFAEVAERVGLYPTQFVVGTRWDAFFRYRNLLHPKDLF